MQPVARTTRAPRRAGTALGKALAVFLGSAGVAAAVVHSAAGPARAQARPADEIVAEFRSYRSPGFSLQHGADEFERLVREVVEGQCRCAWELHRAYPHHAEVPRLLFARWMNRFNYHGEACAALDELRDVLAGDPAPAVARVARLALADAAARCDDVPLAEARALVDAVAGIATRDDPAGWPEAILASFAARRCADPVVQRDLLARRAELAERLGRRTTPASIERALPRVGTALELAFDDALAGARWSLAARRGADVLVHAGALNRWEVQQEGRDALLEELVALRPRARALGVELVTVNRMNADEDAPASVAHARAAGADWPIWNERDHPTDEWAQRLGINAPEMFLWIDGEGRLAGMCERPAPLLERIAGRR